MKELNTNKSQRLIAKEFSVNEKTVRNIKNKHSIKKVGGKPGRPKKLSVREERLILRDFRNGDLENATEGVRYIQKTFSKIVSNEFIRTLLKKNNIKAYHKRKIPFLTKKHLNQRKRYYECHKKKTFEDFKNYVFTDESTFGLIGLEGGRTYYKHINTKPGPKGFI